MLQAILNNKRQEVEQAKQRLPLQCLEESISPGTHRFSRTLAMHDWTLIAECKLASPSKGMLCSRYSVPELAIIYEQSGATSLSVLTDRHFNGSPEDIAAVKAVSGLPVLRKDFIVDPYQIYQARRNGADAVLLIVAVLTDSQLHDYIRIADQLGLDCLVEVHSRAELKRAQMTEARCIGINNRDLMTFTTKLENSLTLLPYCDPDRIIISESGVRNAGDAKRLQAAGARGILAGESLVTATDVGGKVNELTLRS